MGDAAADSEATVVVARVLRARHAFEVLELEARATEEGGVKRAYRRLALLLHPDKNPHAEAQAAFVRLADAYDQLRCPRTQREVLASLDHHRKAAAAAATSKQHQQQSKPAAAATASWKPSSSSSGSSSSRPPGRPRTFMEVLREWEEFEREYMAELDARAAERSQWRAEKRRSQQADRAEREATERQALANALLEDDSDGEGEDKGGGGGLQARSDAWASFLKGKRSGPGGGKRRATKVRRTEGGV